ncbi:sigma-54-dependent transcriptional regulator [Ascidiimonas sp. W6]|uniref:sigma-54-dependent transcriptional regulator n=1 Tax=Ascidiimonas meishanensis TaxID=3128903 RepID=UPI0030EBF619
MPKILLIEDDITFSTMLERFLIKNDFKVQTVHTAKEGLNRISKEKYDLIFSDVRLPDDDGINLLTKIKALADDIPVILMTSYAEVSMAVSAMKKGAFDYISKPFNQDEVLVVIKNALHKKSKNFITKTSSSKNRSKETKAYGTSIKGVSSASNKLNEYIKLVAPTGMSVLITGESGTGKEVVARTIHENSGRKNNPFVAVDCGAIPKEIAASEFFGHIKGSFTGAVNDKKGHFEAANNGTIFLDEVGNLSYENQIQLLRALQERKIKPIGSNKEIAVDIRLITATNENLLKVVRQGKFREDLYHRLNEFSIQVPRLYERKEDLMIFADYFLGEANQLLDKNILGFSDEVILLFQEYPWPGNLRELSNVIKRSVLLTQTNIIQKSVLPSEIVTGNIHELTSEVRSFSKKENERLLIINALAETDNNKSQAAKLLKITRKTLYNKIKEYQIDA